MNPLAPVVFQLALLAAPPSAQPATDPALQLTPCSEPSPASGRQTVFVSDTHFGVGRSGENGAWLPYEDSRWSEDWKAFLSKIDELGGGATDLILNGDTFELWQSVKDDCGNDRTEDQGCTETEALDRLHRVLTQHATEMRALGEFAGRAGNRVFLIPGNHDSALLFPSVAKAALDAFSAPPGRACLATEGYWLSRDGLLYSEHGQQIGHDVNSFVDRWPQPFTTGNPKYLVRTWGERFVQSYYNQFELKYEAIDNLSNEGDGVSYGLAAEGKAQGALGVAKFVKFLLLDQSWAQFVSLLGDQREPVWDVEGIKKYSGDRFVIDSIPAGEMRVNAERALADGELGLSVSQLSDDEIKDICNRRAALYTAQTESHLPPTVSMCPRGHLGAIGERFLVSRDKVLADHLLSTGEKLVRAGRLTPGKPFQVFIYSHTHHAEGGFHPLGGPWQPTVANTGAWQRLLDRATLEKIKTQKGWSDREVLSKLKLENLPPCYSFVLVKPYQDSPAPLLRYWALADGSWTVRTECPSVAVL
jgi:hypothetical protein